MNLNLPITSGAVVSAIDSELKAQPECFAFEVKSVRKDGRWWIVGLKRLSTKAQPLDEAFEGSQAWWPSPSKGSAEVLVVDVEDDEVVLADVTGPPPEKGGKIFLYPPRFLESLRSVWSSEAWTDRVNYWLNAALATTGPQNSGVTLEMFPWLRIGQRDSEILPAWPISFLWGPPGTGKTTTLGALVACLIHQQPKCRILLVSTTNSATDQALVAIDKALEQISGGAVSTERESCKRIGSQFLALHYEGRKHLLPKRDETLIRDLMEHQRRRPEQGNVVAMADWKAKDDELRDRLKQQNLSILKDARLAAMTTTRAAFDHTVLREIPVYDFLIMDEASQVSLAHALSLLPLANQVLFAGDPCQLSPICQSKEPSAKRWIGLSPFELQKLIPEQATCFLSEQSRMVAPICKVVSDGFYGGKLVVCAKEAARKDWQQVRNVGCKENERVTVVPTMADGYYTQAWDGFVRHESAEKIRDLILDFMRKGLTRDDVQVLTPFRAQRRLIRKLLKEAGCIVPVTTVHRAQGSERRVIVFDPVDGSGKFLFCAEGDRLVNVAFSRAQARLVVLLSSGDAVNPILGRLAPPGLSLPLFCELAGSPDFPGILPGKGFAYLGQQYLGKKLDGDSLEVSDAGEKRKFSVNFMRGKCGDPEQCPRNLTPKTDPDSRCCFSKFT